MTDDTITISPGPRFRTAMVLAVLADALQVVVFPLFVAGAASPADDILDFAVGAMMVHLLGWQWEFLPSFFCQARSRSRSSSFLDDGGGQRVPQVEADCGRHGRKSGAVSGAERPATFLRAQLWSGANVVRNGRMRDTREVGSECPPFALPNVRARVTDGEKLDVEPGSFDALANWDRSR
jgi:hypothetical protein